MKKTTTIAGSWQPLLRLLGMMMMLSSIIVSSSSAFKPSIRQSPLYSSNNNHKKSSSSSSLSYASSGAGPMSQVDPNARSGGCPFIVKSHDGDKPYYAIPALFSTQQNEQKHDEQQQQQKEQRPIVLFDKSCHRSQKLVQFLLKYDSQQNLRFAPLQSQVGELLLRRMSDEVRNEVLQQPPQDDEQQQQESTKGNGDGGNNKYYKSLVLCTPDTTYIQSSAMLKILASLSSTSSTGMKTAKRIKLLQYLGLASYIFPTKLRDKLYKFVVLKRRSTSAKNIYDYEQYQDRFVHDEVLTGSTSSSSAATTTTSAVNLFEGENPPQRGDTVRIIWPQSQQNSSFNTKLNDPSITYDEEFPNGLCLVGGRGKITNVDLPLRVVLRVDRTSLGLEKDVLGEETMIAWVKPSEVALV